MAGKLMLAGNLIFGLELVALLADWTEPPG